MAEVLRWKKPFLEQSIKSDVVYVFLFDKVDLIPTSLTARAADGHGGTVCQWFPQTLLCARHSAEHCVTEVRGSHLLWLHLAGLLIL